MSAHAGGVSVSIDNADNSTVLSAPSAVYDLHPPVPTALTGRAAFDPGVEGGVVVTFSQTPVLGRPDANNPTNAANDLTHPTDVLVFEDVAELVCDPSNACTWSYSLPFGLPPGVYHLAATASEPGNPDPITASTHIDITLL